MNQYKDTDHQDTAIEDPSTEHSDWTRTREYTPYLFDLKHYRALKQVAQRGTIAHLKASKYFKIVLK